MNFAERPSNIMGRLASRARDAAFRPASSPSKQKITSEVYRNSLLRCSIVTAVPSVAAVLWTPF